MMSKIESEFKFELGDMVYIRGSQHIAGCRPTHFVVCERIAQECHGGVQQFYKMLGWTGAVSEIALTVEEPAFRPQSDAELADRERTLLEDLKTHDKYVQSKRKHWENSSGD